MPHPMHLPSQSRQRADVQVVVAEDGPGGEHEKEGRGAVQERAVGEVGRVLEGTEDRNRHQEDPFPTLIVDSHVTQKVPLNGTDTWSVSSSTRYS